jgi:hypothetical protein
MIGASSRWVIRGRRKTSAADWSGLMIILGVILLLLGIFLHVSILYVIGIILLILGVIFWILGSVGRPIGGRKYWY